MKKIFILAAILLSAFALRAQSLNIVYESNVTAANKAEVNVYLVNNKSTDLELQSFALELAHNNAFYTGIQKDAFKNEWTGQYAKVQDVQKASNVGSGYSNMFQYGNVDPTVEGSLTLTVPGMTKILALNLTFQTQGAADFYMLNQQEGQANAIFAADGSMVDYTVSGNTASVSGDFGSSPRIERPVAPS